MKSNLDVVVSSGFEKDLEIAKYSCIALEKIASLKKVGLLPLRDASGSHGVILDRIAVEISVETFSIRKIDARSSGEL